MYLLGENIKILNTHDIRTKYYYITSDGKIYNKFLEEIKPFLSNTGYLRVGIYLNSYKNNRRIQKNFSIHRLVAEYFCYNDDPNIKDQVNHINGIKTDNSVSNLEWVSQSENIIKAYDANLCPIKGERSHLHNDRYTDEIIHNICRYLEKRIYIS